MHIKAIYQEVEINKIADDDHSFLLMPCNKTGENNNSTEKDSALRQILLTPPLLQPSGNRFRIITGHKFFQTYKAKTVNDTCPCLILPSETGDMELLALVLENITTSRQPSPIEEAVCLEKAIKAVGKEKATTFFSPLLAMTKRYTPETLLCLLKMNPKQLEEIHLGRLELSTAFIILEMADKDRNEVFHFISDLRLSSSNQRKFIKNSQELGKRQSKSCNEILNTPEVQRIYHDQSLDNPKKTTRIMDWLHKQLFPQLSKAEEDFHSFISTLDLPGNVEIEHAPSFEKDSLVFTCTFADKKIFSDKWLELKKIISD